MYLNNTARKAPLTRMLLVAIAAAVVLIAGCKSGPDKRPATPDRLYEQAKKNLDSGDYTNAIKLYEQLEARFPFSNPARQGHIDLMYAYYRNRETESAVDQADQFIRENPAHPRVDYAHYIKGMVWFERNPNFLERWFRADLTQRPPIDARKSFQAFQTLITQFPNSEYADDARQRMAFLRNRLANYEVYVAEYYLKRGAYVGAINRAKYALENYDGAPSMRRALEVMVASYSYLGMKDLAENSKKVLAMNFPNDSNYQAPKRSWWRFW